MKSLINRLLASVILLLVVVCLTASSTPGYDDNGLDIDECQIPGSCPFEYTCINTPGGYYCISPMEKLLKEEVPQRKDIQLLLMIAVIKEL